VLNKSIKAVLTLLILGSFSQVKAQEKFLSIKAKKYIADVVLTNKISFNENGCHLPVSVKAKKLQFLEEISSAIKS
jgi:outer membrane protein insertion porin family